MQKLMNQEKELDDQLIKLQQRYNNMENESNKLKPIEKLTSNIIDYDVSLGKEVVHQRVAKAHQELQDFFAKLESKSADHSSSNSTAED